MATPDQLNSLLQEDWATQERQGIVLTDEQKMEQARTAYKNAGFTVETSPVGPRASREPTTREQVSGFARPALEGVGGFAGALPGILAQNPLLAVGGAGLGAAGGGQLATMLDVGLGLRQAPSFTAQGREALKNLGAGFGGEGIAQGFQQIAIRPLGQRLYGFDPRLEARVRDFRGISETLGTPADLKQTKPLRQFERLLDMIPSSAGVLQRKRASDLTTLLAERDRLRSTIDVEAAAGGERPTLESLNTRIRGAVDTFIKDVELDKQMGMEQAREAVLRRAGTPFRPSDIGYAVQSKAERVSRESKAMVDRLFTEARAHIAPGAKVRPTELQRTAQQLLAEAEKAPPESRGAYPLALLKQFAESSGDPQADEVLKAVKGLPLKAQAATMAKLGLDPSKAGYDPQGFRLVLSDLRDRSTGVAKSLGGGVSTNEFRVLTQLKQAATADERAFWEAQGGEAAVYARLGYALSGTRKELLNDPRVRQVVLANPEKVVDLAVRPGDDIAIENLQRVLGRDFEVIRQGLTNKLLRADTGGALNPQRLLADLDRYSQPTLERVLGRSRARELRQFAEWYAKEGAMEPGNPILRQLLKKDPSTVIGRIEHPNDVRVIRAAMPASEFPNVQAAYVESLLSTTKGHFTPQEGAARILKAPKPVLREILGPDAAAGLEDAAKTPTQTGLERFASVVQGLPLTGRLGEGTLEPVAQTLLAWKVGSVVMRGGLRGISEVVLLPRTLASLYTSRTGQRLLIDGFRVSPNSAEGVAVATRLMAYTTKGIIEEPYRRQAQERP